MISSIMLLINKAQLKQFYQKCQKDKIIGIDTEFYRINTYFPIPCLIQISNLSQTVIIDMIDRKLDLTILQKLLLDKQIVKIIHAGLQDIEIIYNLFGEIPSNLFDTQNSLMPLGYNNSTSYSSACKDFLNIKICKEEQFIDWRKRPLSRSRKVYAINDVKHLIPLYREILKCLKLLNRTDWIKEMHNKFYHSKIFSKRASESWKKVKFSPKNLLELTYLKEISELRESEAMRKNIPVKQVLENKQLILISRSDVSIGHKKIIIGKINSTKLKKEIMKITERKLTPKLLNPVQNKLSDKQESLVKIAKKLIEKKSVSLNIHPSLIANKEEIKSLILGDKTIIINWKFEVFSKEYLYLKKLIAGFD